jgi:recombinational DNA repair protein (RecF pathway)
LTHKVLEFDLIASVCLNLKQSLLAYQEYLQQGKKFKHAKNLKYYNTKIIDLLVQNEKQIPLSLKQDADKLLQHYTHWLAKWNQLAEKSNPSADDVFAFENEFTFPKTASENFEKANKK